MTAEVQFPPTSDTAAPPSAGTDVWAQLNERQRVYLKAVYDADQEAEAQARSGWEARPASQWRWLLYTVKVKGGLSERTTIQSALERAGQLDSGAGSSLAALNRRGLVLVRDTWIDLFLGPAAAVEVQITRTGRALIRAALGLQAPLRVPPGLLSRPYLWDAMAWLYEGGEKGFEHVYSRRDQPKEQLRYRPSWNTLLVLQDRRDGSYWEHPGPGPGEPSWKADHHRYRLSPLGRDHYARHWACYADLFPQVQAPEPPSADGAHQALADHFVRKPRGLLTAPQWRLLVALVRVHQASNCPLRRILSERFERYGRPLPSPLQNMPNGLLDTYILKQITPSRTAAAKLVGYRSGALAAYADVGHLKPYDPAYFGDLPALLLHVTDAGIRHFTDYLDTYRKLYPDVRVMAAATPTPPAIMDLCG